MAKIKNILDYLKENILLFDGGMGTELYKRGVFINKCFDYMNISNPNLVQQVHSDYIKAGADVIETNTFGANRFKLSAFQLKEQLYDINYIGTKIAKETAGNDVLVAGSIGPLGIQIEPLGPISREEAIEFFSEQIEPLLDADVDILIFETFVYLEELNQAVKAGKKLTDKPILALMTIDEDCSSLTGAKPEIMINELTNTGADIIGINCTVGPQVMLEWLEKVRGLTDLPIAIMPNAGKPKNIDGRNIYLASPEYFAEYTKHFILSGANVVGGCCGTTPKHIKAMRNAISALKPNKILIKSDKTKEREKPHKITIPIEKKSRLSRRLSDGHFVTFVELLSPHGVSAETELEKAKELNYFGIDVINIPDGPRASARMSALALAVLIQRRVGIETVLHYVCRDRNVIGIQSDLLGAYALGIKNILAITGDPPKLGNYPDATAVFDVDSIGLVNILNRLNNGLDIAGNEIGNPTGFFIGVGANPGAINLEKELNRLFWKVDAGAEFIITQPVFDVKLFENFVRKIEQYKLPLIAGLWPLSSIRNAEFMNNEIPGCSVPESILKRLKKVSDSKEKSIEEGIKIAIEILNNIKDLINGIQISVPFGRIQIVFEILKIFKLY